jgi:hypothetical protein
MMKIRVFRILLSLDGLMNQEIEPGCIRIPLHDGFKLLFVELQDRLHRFAKLMQKHLRNFAIDDLRATGFARWLLVLVGTHVPAAILRVLGCTQAAIANE